MNNKKKKLSFIYISIITILSYVPIALAVIYSFNDSKSSVEWAGFTLRWYKEVFADRSIASALVNSIVLAALSSLLSAAVAVLAVLGFRKKKIVFIDTLVKRITMIPLMIPEVIFAVAYLAFFSLLKLPFGMLTLVIGHMSFCIPYIYMQLEARVVLMDDSLSDAARLMGAGPVRAFWDVILPYLMPALLSGIFMSFAMSFDDVIISMFVTGARVNTLALKIYSQVKTTMTPKTNAICTLLLLAMLICLVLARLFSGIRLDRLYSIDSEK